MTFSASAKRFLRSTRAGATAITAAAVTVMAVGGAALITDHVWLVDQRDTLKSAANSASIATTLAMNRMLESDSRVSDADLTAALNPVARRYVELNLSHLPTARLTRAKETLVVTLAINRRGGRVDVTAEADLGGTLVARALPLFGGDSGPGTMQATAAVDCAASAIEVVLALDVTASMHGKIDNSLPATGDNRRLNAVIKAAKALIEELHSTCDESSIAIAIVPWDKTVRLPDPDRWRLRHWVEIGHNRTGTIPSDWSGCVEDRAHSANPFDARALGRATSLSLDLPSSHPYPAFIYPDTRRFSVAPMADLIRTAFPDLSGTDAGRDLEANLEKRRENDWGVRGRLGVGGPNFHCTSTNMLALTTNRVAIEAALDRVKANRVWGGGTMAHLGVTWGRRMLAPSWRAVWGGDIHPIDPAQREVTKILVLLTDGGNVLDDDHKLLPGRVNAAHVEVPACEADSRSAGCRQGEFGTSYSALGRFGSGPVAHGYYYPGWGVDRSNGMGTSTETALSALMKRSCALARGEGLTVYAIGAMPRVRFRWRDALVACSGAPGTADADRAEFYFHAADGAALDRAFRTIARRAISLRRVS